VKDITLEDAAEVSEGPTTSVETSKAITASSAALEYADSLKESCSLRALCVSEEPPSAAVENADSLKELCVSKEPTPLTDTSKEIPRRIYS
jgi:hypothetical protein